MQGQIFPDLLCTITTYDVYESCNGALCPGTTRYPNICTFYPKIVWVLYSVASRLACPSLFGWYSLNGHSNLGSHHAMRKPLGYNILGG